jgi:hypothetical protein
MGINSVSHLIMSGSEQVSGVGIHEIQNLFNAEDRPGATIRYRRLTIFSFIHRAKVAAVGALPDSKPCFSDMPKPGDVVSVDEALERLLEGNEYSCTGQTPSFSC